MVASDIASIVLAVCVAFLVAGCGNEALRVNATVARAMLEVQAESGPVIRELRVNAGVEAGREAHDRGAPEAEAQAAATAAASAWQCAIDGHGIYASAVGAYIDALALWANGVELELADALPFVRRAIDAYGFLASCLRSLGSDALPDAPSFLNLIPPVWSVTDG